MLRFSRHLTIAAAAATLFAQPALARSHGPTAHRLIDRSHHHREAMAQRHRRSSEFHHHLARVYWRRRVYGYEPQRFFGENEFSAPWQNRDFGQQGFAPQGFAARGFGRHGFAPQGFGAQAPMAGMAAAAASANGVPSSLVDRVIRRESGGNARATSRGNYGLMQIRLGTARAMGYEGSAAGLLDPQTNLTYAVRYLAGAYRAAGGNENRAVALYARGYRAPRLQYASYSAPQPPSGPTQQRSGLYDWSGGYAPAVRAVHRRRYAF